jgi:uncharacterized protein YjbJ (UPF0337 family)
MNWDRNWKQLTGNVKRQFGKLIDGQLDLWEGKRKNVVQLSGFVDATASMNKAVAIAR